MPDQSRPQVVVHSSISIDGAATGFEPDLAQHYGALGALDVDASLVGSVTMASGLTMQEQPVPDPGPHADRPPPGREGRNLWFLVDSSARLQGHMHELRAFPMLRDVVVLISATTPHAYAEHLAQRHYDHHRCGDDHVDLAAALHWMRATYGVRRVHVDSGPTLVGVLFEHGLVDELSLLVHPLVVGSSGRRLIDSSAGLQLELVSEAVGDGGVVHLRYLVPPGPDGRGKPVVPATGGA